MSDRFFLDTNIFIYTFDSGSPAKQRKARELIQKGLTSHKGVVSYQVVQEFFNVALRRFATPMKLSEAEQYLDTAFRPMLSIHSTATLFKEALRIQADTGFSWYDSLIVAAAVQADCRTLFSEDLQHGRKIGSLAIANPFL